MGRPVYIYALKDPRTDEVRYVGKALDPVGRLKRHVAGARRGHASYVCNWLRSLPGDPVLAILETTDEGGWAAAERKWIARFPRLTNVRDGGAGAPGPQRNHRMTEEGRAAIAEANRQRAASMTPEQRRTAAQRARAAVKENKGFRGAHSAATKRKIGDATRGRKLSPETRAKIGAGVSRARRAAA